MAIPRIQFSQPELEAVLEVLNDSRQAGSHYLITATAKISGALSKTNTYGIGTKRVDMSAFDDAAEQVASTWDARIEAINKKAITDPDSITEDDQEYYQSKMGYRI